jgi:hypothetical protein
VEAGGGGGRVLDRPLSAAADGDVQGMTDGAMVVSWLVPAMAIASVLVGIDTLKFTGL